MDFSSAGDRFVSFAGLVRDNVTGLNLAIERAENPAIGRWTQQDPLSFAAGDANLYRYVGNGVTSGTDLSGLQELSLYGYGGFRFGNGQIIPYAGFNWSLTSPGWSGPTTFEFNPIHFYDDVLINQNPYGINPGVLGRPIGITPFKPVLLPPLIGPVMSGLSGPRKYHWLYYPGLRSPVLGVRCTDGRIYPTENGRPVRQLPHPTVPGYYLGPGELPRLFER